MPYGSETFGNPEPNIYNGRRSYKRTRPDDSTAASASASSSQTFSKPNYTTFDYMTKEDYVNKFEHLDNKHKINKEELNKTQESLRQLQLEQTKLNKDLEELNKKKHNQGWIGRALGSQKDIDNQIKRCTDNINQNKEYCSKLEGEISKLCKIEYSIINSKEEIREQYDNSETDNIRYSTVSIRTYNNLYINLFLEEYISSRFGIKLDIYNKAFGFLIEQLKSKIIEMYGLEMYGLKIDKLKIEEPVLISASEKIDVFKTKDDFQTFLDNYGKKEPVGNKRVGPLFSLTRPVSEAPSFSHDVAKKPAKSKKRGSGRRARSTRKSKK